MMKLFKHLIIIMLLVLVAVDGGYADPKKDPPPKKLKLFNPEGKKMIVRVGEQFHVTLKVTGAYEMTGVSTNFTYEPTYIKPVDTDPLTPATTEFDVVNYNFLPNTSPLVAMQQDPQGNEQPGTIITSLVLLNPNDAQTSNVLENLFSIKFEALAPGTSVLTFTFRQITDINGEITAVTDWLIPEDAEVLARTVVELVVEVLP
jgi:hypothetical protein